MPRPEMRIASPPDAWKVSQATTPVSPTAPAI